MQEKVSCECGARVASRSIARHRNTKKHKDSMKAIENARGDTPMKPFEECQFSDDDVKPAQHIAMLTQRDNPSEKEFLKVTGFGGSTDTISTESSSELSEESSDTDIEPTDNQVVADDFDIFLSTLRYKYGVDNPEHIKCIFNHILTSSKKKLPNKILLANPNLNRNKYALVELGALVHRFRRRNKHVPPEVLRYAIRDMIFH